MLFAKEQIEANYDYLILPTFTFNGHTYKVAPSPNEIKTWREANDYCNGLTIGGYSDWRLPTEEELSYMCIEKESIGGFVITAIEGNSIDLSYYWSSTAMGDQSHRAYYFIECTYCGPFNYAQQNFRPIRVVE